MRRFEHAALSNEPAHRLIWSRLRRGDDGEKGPAPRLDVRSDSGRPLQRETPERDAPGSPSWNVPYRQSRREEPRRRRVAFTVFTVALRAGVDPGPVANPARTTLYVLRHAEDQVELVPAGASTQQPNGKIARDAGLSGDVDQNPGARPGPR